MQIVNNHIMRGMVKNKMANEYELCELLYRAEDKIFSCGCPYLALAEEMGYISCYVATHNPDIGLSNFGRISTKQCFRTAGFSTEYAMYTYKMIENGLPLTKIGDNILEHKAKVWNRQREAEIREQQEREEEYEDEQDW